MTSSTLTYRLTNRQKWQLALSIFVIYWPIRLYVNIPAHYVSWNFLVRNIPFWILETILSVLFFYAWINVTEWLQQRFFKRFGDGFLIEFKIPAQLATLGIASALAVVFNIGFYTLWHSVDDTLQRGFGLIRDQEVRPQKPTPPVSEERRKNREQRRRVNNGMTVMAMLSAFYLAANRRAYQRLEDVQIRAERLEKENVQAQFAALKSQVNPHFLFNSLSILSSLVHADADLSEKFIDQLSRAYRYILEQKDNDRVLLKTELEFIQAYRFLLNIRFENKFDVVINVPEADQSRYSIAPLTLQLLVENAVKHNRMSTREPLHVHIRLEGDCLVVENNLQTRPQSETSTGVGLKNIITRYAMLTDKSVWVGETEGSFIVKVPLLT